MIAPLWGLQMLLMRRVNDFARGFAGNVSGSVAIIFVLVLSVLRYMTPAIGLLFVLVPSLVARRPEDALDRNAVRLGQRDAFDVLDLVALGQIRRAAGVDQADAAHVHGLLPDIYRASADIDIGVTDRGDHLGYGNVVSVEFIEIDFDLVFLGCPAPGIHLNDAVDPDFGAGRARGPGLSPSRRCGRQVDPARTAARRGSRRRCR